MFNIYRGSKLITTMAPERRFYKASGQPQTMPNIYPTFMQDLFLVNDIYLVYEGKNETTGRPIIKAHLNPLVPWIWIGLVIMVFGTVVALAPNYVPVTVAAPAHAPVRETAHVGAGD
jgi:cytochrome c-type biogenesis protein CcmF